eukprot:26030_1
MILNKLETMIVFSFISPLLFPLTVISIMSNVYFYNAITSEKATHLFGQKWVLKPNNTSLILPIHLLWFGIILSQVLIVVFCIVSFQDPLFAYIVSLVCFINDVFFTIKLKKDKKQNMMQIFKVEEDQL